MVNVYYIDTQEADMMDHQKLNLSEWSHTYIR